MARTIPATSAGDSPRTRNRVKRDPTWTSSAPCKIAVKAASVSWAVNGRSPAMRQWEPRRQEYRGYDSRNQHAQGQNDGRCRTVGGKQRTSVDNLKITSITSSPETLEKREEKTLGWHHRQASPRGALGRTKRA
eukprot:scaffold1069_cov155-Amphora_coffeaeformis.AAC.2